MHPNNQITVYITKYALAKGHISQVQATLCFTDGLVSVPGLIDYLRLGVDAFETLEEAMADAEERRRKRLVSLEKSMAKLRKMEFKLQP